MDLDFWGRILWKLINACSHSRARFPASLLTVEGSCCLRDRKVLHSCLLGPGALGHLSQRAGLLWDGRYLVGNPVDLCVYSPGRDQVPLPAIPISIREPKHACFELGVLNSKFVPGFRV